VRRLYEFVVKARHISSIAEIEVAHKRLLFSGGFSGARDIYIRPKTGMLYLAKQRAIARSTVDLEW
jgi:hypothetical protein